MENVSLGFCPATAGALEQAASLIQALGVKTFRVIIVGGFGKYITKPSIMEKGNYRFRKIKKLYFKIKNRVNIKQ